MTEIKIEKKKPIWPWVLVILIILAAIYFFWYYNDRNFDNDDDLIQQDTISQMEDRYQEENDVWVNETLYTGTYGTVRDEQALADYFIFVDSLDHKSADKDFYRSAFFKLITATKRQAEIEMVDVNNNISAAMDNAEKLTNEATATTKADNAKKAADEVSKALKAIQVKEYKNLSEDVKEVEKAVAGIDGAQMIDKQENNLNTFFDKTAVLLQKMNDNENNQ